MSEDAQALAAEKLHSLVAALERRMTEYREQKAQLVAYLLSKVKAGDWHAVQDAASDIREIDARVDELTKD